MIRVLHVVTDLSFSGGDHIYLEKLLTHLATQRPGQFELHVAEIRGHANGNSPDVYDRLERRGVAFHVMPAYEFGTMSLTAPRFLRQLAEELQIDVMHSHTFYSELSTFICRHGSEAYRSQFGAFGDLELAEEISQAISTDWTRLYRDLIPFRGWPAEAPRVDPYPFKWVSTKHISTLISLSNERDLETRYGQSPQVLARASALNEGIQSLVARHSDLVVAINSQATGLFQALGVETAHIPVSIADDLLVRERRAEPVPTASGAITFAYASRIASKKNPDTLVRAFNIHSLYRPQDRLVMIGDGPMLGECREIGRSNPAIDFLGHMPREQMFEKLRDVDAVCLFSSEEGLPLIVQEAMALGVPVLTTLVGGLGDLIEDGKTGLVARGTDAADVVQCLGRFATLSPTDRSRIVRNAERVIGSRLGAKESFERYADEYRRLASGQPQQQYA